MVRAGANGVARMPDVDIRLSDCVIWVPLTLRLIEWVSVMASWVGVMPPWVSVMASWVRTLWLDDPSPLRCSRGDI